MNNTMRAMLIASFALAFTACKKEEAAPVADAQQALVAPAKDDDAGWKKYLQSVAVQNMGNITNSPFLYYLSGIGSGVPGQVRPPGRERHRCCRPWRAAGQHAGLRFVRLGQDGRHDPGRVQGRVRRLDEGCARGVHRPGGRQRPRPVDRPADRRRVHLRRSQVSRAMAAAHVCAARAASIVDAAVDRPAQLRRPVFLCRHWRGVTPCR